MARVLSPGEELLALHLKAYGLLEERGYAFAEPRLFKFDFAWPQRGLAVEVDGGVHRINSRWRGDLEKFNLAAALGWRVYHFHPDQVRSGTAIDVIRAEFAENREAVLDVLRRKQ